MAKIVVKIVVKRPQLFTAVADFIEQLCGNRVQERWSGERDSNPRPQLWESCALPTELPPRVFDFELEFRTSVLKCRPSQVASRMSLDNPFWRPLALDNPSTLWTILPRARRPHSIVPEWLRHSGHPRAVVRNSRTHMAEPEDGAAFWRERFDMMGQSP